MPNKLINLPIFMNLLFFVELAEEYTVKNKLLFFFELLFCVYSN